MRKTYITITLAVIIGVASVAWASDPPPIEDRPITVTFKGELLDANDLPFDGVVDAEAQFYDAPGGVLQYQEDFTGVEVVHGRFVVPLFAGTPDGFAQITKEQVAAIGELYVDFYIDGVKFLDAKPMRSAFAAVRAEVARYAEGVRKEFVIDKSDVPTHSAQLITTDQLVADRIPQFNASKITTGAFSLSQLPAIPPSYISGGTFSSDVLPSTLSISKFSGGQLLDEVISPDVIRWDDLAFEMGVVGNNGYIDVPDGFQRSQCKVILSLREIDGDHGVDQYHMAYRPAGEVECRWSNNEMGTNERGCLANYMMICRNY